MQDLHDVVGRLLLGAGVLGVEGEDAADGGCEEGFGGGGKGVGGGDGGEGFGGEVVGCDCGWGLGFRGRGGGG